MLLAWTVQLDQSVDVVGAGLLQRPGLAAAADSPPMAAVVAAAVPCTIIITANEAMLQLEQILKRRDHESLLQLKGIMLLYTCFSHTMLWVTGTCKSYTTCA